MLSQSFSDSGLALVSDRIAPGVRVTDAIAVALQTYVLKSSNIRATDIAHKLKLDPMAIKNCLFIRVPPFCSVSV
jgi:hypothetical protein